MPAKLLSSATRVVAREVDRAFRTNLLTAPKLVRRRSAAEGLGHQERLTGLGAIAEIYAQPTLIEDPQRFFAPSPPIAPQVRRVRGYGKQGEVLDLRWRSEYETLWGQPGFVPDLTITGVDSRGSVRTKYMAEHHNLTAYARWFRHVDGPHPAIMILHGYLAGELNVEEQVWPTRALFNAGYDIIFTVLPFHGARKSPKRLLAPPRFPASDPRFTIEGFRHLVFDHIALADYMLEGRVKSIGVMGMSLGGYSASLLTTVDPRWSFVIPVVPLSCTAQFARDTGRFIGTPEEQAEQQRALEAAQRAISPLERPAKIPSDKIKVVAGAADVVTGLPHAERLAEHFDSELIVFDGGHLLQFGIRDAVLSAFDKVTGEG